VSPERKLEETEKRLLNLASQLMTAAESAVNRREERLLRDIKSLEAVNPLSVLSRGYAVIVKDRKVLAGTETLIPGDIIKIRMKDGERTAVITNERQS
jgi:exodeoxyribonuclease VII large subunit